MYLLGVKITYLAKNLGHLKEAKLCITKAISFKPNLAQAYNNLGNILFELEKVDQAIINYSKALEINPNNSDLLNNLGNLYLGSGENQKAKRFFIKAIKYRSN